MCTSGVCEIAPALLNGTGPLYRIEVAEARFCAKSKARREQACNAVQGLKDKLVHKECHGNILYNKTVTLPVTPKFCELKIPARKEVDIVVNSSQVCKVVRKLLYDDNFDDEVSPAFIIDFILFPAS